MLKRVYVWEFPVRLTHWVNVASVLMLSLTGFYIGAPFIHAISSEQHVMGWMRMMHFIFAYGLTASLLVRIYWAFRGNQYARWDQLMPVTGERWTKVWETAKFYLFMRPSPPGAAGHSALAGVTYIAIFFLLIVEIITGFALYSQGKYGFIWTVLGGWLLSVMHVQTIRLYHHLIMWFLIAFTIIHVYIAWLLDLVEKNGLMSSIFGGYKALDEE